MAMEITNNYNAYENIYAAQKKAVDSQKKTVENTEVKESAVKKSSNEEYLKSLQKQVPYMKLQIGSAVNTKNDGKVDVLDINPKLLEKMQNDPEAAQKYTQRIKDVEAAHKFVDNYLKSTGSTVICSHAYLDENGNYCNFTVSVRRDALNEKLRKEAAENAKKQIEKTRENARKKAEQLTEQLEEKAEEAKKTEDNQDQGSIVVVKSDTAQDKAENLLSEKLENADDGKIYLDNDDMQTIINAAKEEAQGQPDKVKNPVVAGNNFDMQI